MKVVLANVPRFGKKSFAEKFSNIDGGGIPNLAVPYMIAYQEKYGDTKVDWYVKEFRLENKTPLEASKEIEKIDPDVVGFSGYTQEINDVYNFSQLIGATMPETIRILGGYHATVLPEEALDKGFDVVFRGESFESLKDFIDELNAAENISGVDLSKIRGISYKENGTKVHNELMDLIDINNLPYPAWDKCPTDLYTFSKGHGFMMSSFGCNMNCTFCQFPPGDEKRKHRRHRVMEPQKVVDHMRYLKRKFPNLENMIIIDDDFFEPEERAMEIFDLKHDDKYASGLKLHTTSRAEHISKNGVKNQILLDKMKKGLVKTNFIGVETSNKHILKKFYNKGEKWEDIKKAIRFCNEEGIDVYASMIISPWDRFKDYLRTSYSCRHASIFQAPQLTPYPGTILFEREKEKILSFNWRNYDGAHPLIRGDSVEPKQIKKQIKKSRINQVMFNFYVNFGPSQIFRNPGNTYIKFEKTIKAIFD
ncbi:MAG: B12-binding domain-containing radical SAM protein [archaeon]|nr:MAG: B12-binding domain-containing radical SAM protein [archaeon]